MRFQGKHSFHLRRIKVCLTVQSNIKDIARLCKSYVKEQENTSKKSIFGNQV